MPRAARSAFLLSILPTLVVGNTLVAQNQPSAKPGKSAAPAAAVPAKPTLAAADYAKWETLGNGSLSPDGKWLVYDFRRANGSTQLQYRPVDSNDEHVVRSASNAQFTSNSRWLIYTATPDTAGGGRAGRGGRGGGGAGRGGGGGGAGADRNKVVVVDLRAGTSQAFDDVQSYALSSDGSHVALRRYATPGRRTADVIVRDLDAGTELTLGNVSEMAWSDDGAQLAMTIDVEGKTGNGVQLLSTKTGAIRSLEATDNQYTGLTWRAHSSDLAVLRTHVDTAFADTGYAVVAWRSVGAGAQKQTYDFSNDNNFPKSMRVSSNRFPQWSEDGATIILGMAPREYKVSADRRAPGELPPARVQVWHYKDVREFHQQEVNGNQDRTRTTPVAWHVGAPTVVKFVRRSV